MSDRDEKRAYLRRVGVTLLVLGLFFSVFGVMGLMEYRSLQAEGVVVTAHVNQIARHYKSGIPTGYTIQVEFPHEGRLIPAELLVSDALAERLRSGAGGRLVEVRYLPDDPTVVNVANEADRAIGHGEWIEPYIGLLLALLVALPGMACLMAGELRYRRTV